MLNTILTLMVAAMMGGPGHMGKMAKVMGLEMTVNALVQNEDIQKEVGLSDEQLTKIRDIKFKTDKEVVKLRSDMELKEIDLREELSKDNPDMTKVEKLIKAKHAIMADIELAKVKEYTAVKKILSEKQIEKLKEIMGERMRKMMWRRRMNEKRKPGMK